MAEMKPKLDPIKQLGEQLNCAICLGRYSQPKVLRCLHVFCRGCLVPLVVRNEAGELVLACPTCRQPTPISEEKGVSGLQVAFHIVNLQEIHNSVKDFKPTLSAVEEDKSAVVNSASSSAPSSPSATRALPETAAAVDSDCCPVHKEKKVELYCHDCDELICYKCAIRDGRHYSHRYNELSDIYDKAREEVAKALSPIEGNVQTIKLALLDIERCSGEVSDQREHIEEQIHASFKKLHDTLDVRKMEVINKLHGMTQSKLKMLAVQKDEMETALAKLSSCLNFAQNSLQVIRCDDLLKTKAMILNRAQELSSVFQADQLRLKTEADVKFSVLPDVEKLCKKYGKMFSPSLPDPSKCYVTCSREGRLQVATVGVKSSILLKAVSFSGKPCSCSELMKSMKCILVSETTGGEVNSSIEQIEDGAYEVCYTPVVKGKHKAYITAEDQDIRGSPFSLTVKLPMEKLGITPLATVSNLSRPCGIAITNKGEMVVTERDKDCVSIFSSRGKKIHSFGTRGSGPGQFVSPHGIAVDTDGSILVADNGNHRIQKFTPEGAFLAATPSGTRPKGSAHFFHPMGITVSLRNGKIYVVDEHRMYVLNSDLTPSGTSGRHFKSQFSYPQDIACDQTGKVYVADSKNHCIKVFSPDGHFQSKFSCSNRSSGVAWLPFSIAVDDSNMLYVSDNNHHCVSVMTSEGQCVKTFGREGAAPGEFKYPHGVAVDSDGVVYVCDQFNNRIQLL